MNADGPPRRRNIKEPNLRKGSAQRPIEDYLFFPAACESALPASVLVVALERLLDSAFAALVATFGLVTFLLLDFTAIYFTSPRVGCIYSTTQQQTRSIQHICMDNMKVDILGTTYSVVVRNVKEDKRLEGYSGYCDPTSHELVIEDGEGSDLRDFPAYQRRVLRHEIIHAFMFESGLGSDATYKRDEETHPELMIDWFARQAPKIYRTFQAAGIID